MKIILKIHRPKGSVGEVVKINREAQKTLSTIMNETGLSARYIVSQMIIQGADYVELIEEDT